MTLPGGPVYIQGEVVFNRDPAMRVKHSALLLTAGFILMPTLLWSQPGGGGGAGGAASGQAAFFSRMDPDQLFNMLGKGQDVIRVESLDPMARTMFDRFASRFGISGNEITRESFRESFAKIKEAAASGQLPQLMAPGKNEGPGGGMDRILDDRFRQLDRNQDGVLSNDELNGHPLQDERDRYDTSGDGMIDLTEYKAYAQARIGGGGMGGGPGGAGGPDKGEPEEAKRPTVYRAGNLPRDFPYAGLDASGDNDGQVGLYEWKNSGMPISQFLGMDLNKDGFLTVDEYYRYVRQQQPQTARSTSLFGDVPDPALMAGRGQGRGGPGGDMMNGGRGGPGGPGGDMTGGGRGGPGGDMMGMGRGGPGGPQGMPFDLSGMSGRGGITFDLSGMGRGGPGRGGPGGDMMNGGQARGGPGGDTTGGGRGGPGGSGFGAPGAGGFGVPGAGGGRGGMAPGGGGMSFDPSMIPGGGGRGGAGGGGFGIPGGGNRGGGPGGAAMGPGGGGPGGNRGPGGTEGGPRGGGRKGGN